ncbi:hypothetical protein VNO80_18952 [Phaseolus coccineus]|uniref:Uncharacterized protein n=1 Tax=Phaseolus coccineus TaxID=3886 RepID=A0AAN9MK00_PHACN
MLPITASFMFHIICYERVLKISIHCLIATPTTVSCTVKNQFLLGFTMSYDSNKKETVDEGGDNEWEREGKGKRMKKKIL